MKVELGSSLIEDKDTETPESLTEEKEDKTPDTLRGVREKYGTLIARPGSVGCIYHSDYRGLGDKVLIITTSEGIRGGGGEAFIDIALSVEDARQIFEVLKEIFPETEQKRELSIEDARRVYDELKKYFEGEGE